MNKKNEYQDEGLKGNERIEDAIFALQKEATQEQLAHTLTVIRRRMKEGGQLIVAVEPDPAQAQMKLQTVRTPDGKIWWSAFTSFEEELKGADQVKSTFLSEISSLSRYEHQICKAFAAYKFTINHVVLFCRIVCQRDDTCQ